MNAKELFEILTDYKNLVYFKTPQVFNPRQIQQQIILQQYHFNIIHIKEDKDIKVDILSRLPKSENTSSNKEIIEEL